MTIRIASLAALVCALAAAAPAEARMRCDNDGRCVESGVARGVARVAAPKRVASKARAVRVVEARPASIGGKRGVGVVRSKGGASAVVNARYQAQFQAYVDDVEAAGGRILFMGGYRPGTCAPPRHKHPCGMAIDLCQLGWGKVDKRCSLPAPARLAAIAARHGLQEGGEWCSRDYGHAEVGRSAGPCTARWPRLVGNSRE